MTHETDIAMLKRDIEDLRSLCNEQKEKIDALERLDKHRMRAAVITLGTLVFGMGAYIWRVVVEGKI